MLPNFFMEVKILKKKMLLRTKELGGKKYD